MKPFITGTAAYGPFTDDSDIDIVMMYYDGDRLKCKLEAGGIKTSEPGKLINPDYEGFTFEIYGRSFQIIYVVNEAEYEQWKYSTEVMRDIEQQTNRENRLRLAEKFRKEYQA